jgi:hypothetical protein
VRRGAPLRDGRLDQCPADALSRDAGSDGQAVDLQYVRVRRRLQRVAVLGVADDGAVQYGDDRVARFLVSAEERSAFGGHTRRAVGRCPGHRVDGRERRRVVRSRGPDLDHSAG